MLRLSQPRDRKARGTQSALWKSNFTAHETNYPSSNLPTFLPTKGTFLLKVRWHVGPYFVVYINGGTGELLIDTWPGLTGADLLLVNRIMGPKLKVGGVCSRAMQPESW